MVDLSRPRMQRQHKVEDEGQGGGTESDAAGNKHVPPSSSNNNTELYWLSPNYTDPSKLTFPQQMHRLLREHDNSKAVAWLPDGKAFVVLDQKKFTGDVLPRYFGKNIAYTSWTRRLRRWGWQNVAKSTYYNRHFHRDRPMQCLRMNYDRTPNRETPERGLEAEASNRSLSSINPLSSPNVFSQRNLMDAQSNLDSSGMGSAFGSSGGGGGGGLSNSFNRNQNTMADSNDAISRYVNQMQMNMMDRQMEELNRAQMTRSMTLQQLKQQQELLAQQQRMMQMAMSHSNHGMQMPSMDSVSEQGPLQNQASSHESKKLGSQFMMGGAESMPQSHMPYHHLEDDEDDRLFMQQLGMGAPASIPNFDLPSQAQQQFNTTVAMHQNASQRSQAAAVQNMNMSMSMGMNVNPLMMDPFAAENQGNMSSFGNNMMTPKPDNFDWESEGKEDTTNSAAMNRLPMPPSFMPRHNRRPGAA